MRRSFIILLAVLLGAASLLFGCSSEPEITGIAIKDYDGESVHEILKGSLDYSDFTLVVSYDDGESEEIALTDEMLSAADKLKLYREGTHTITFNYGEHSTSLKISVNRSSFGDVRFPDDMTFTYNGEAHTVELCGDIPAGARVSYPQGNSFVNAGSYDVIAVLTGDGYITKEVTSTVTIERADYDMSTVRFEDKTFTYNGRQHSLAISGTLPDGVSRPTYYVGSTPGAGATEAGQYTVTATFLTSDPNYNPIPNMTATLTIERASYSVGNLDLIALNSKGTALGSDKKTYDGESLQIRIDNSALLPRGSTVAYTVSANGAAESEQMSSVLLTDAGVYTVTAYFTLPDSKNYVELAPMEKTFTIEKAEYDMSGVHLDSTIIIYDGLKHSIVIDGELPAGVSLGYVYHLNGAPITHTDLDGDGACDGCGAEYEAEEACVAAAKAGNYTVVAEFSHSNANYAAIPDMSATLSIQRASIDVSQVTISAPFTVIYDGSAASVPQPENLPTGTTWSAEIRKGTMNAAGAIRYPTAVSEAVEEGYYSITYDLSAIDAENYVIVGLTDLKTTFVINRYIDVSGVVFSTDGIDLTYDAEAKTPTLSALPEHVLLASTTLYSVIGDSASPVSEAVTAGTYRIVATLITDAEYYLLSPAEPVTFEFEITKSVIDISGVSFSGGDGALEYDGTAKLLPTLSALPAGVLLDSVTLYQIFDTQEIVVSEAVNAGSYVLKAVLILTDSTNYALSADNIVKHEFSIAKKKISIDDTVTMFTVSGAPHSNGSAITIDYATKDIEIGLTGVPAEFRSSILINNEDVTTISAEGTYYIYAYFYAKNEANYERVGISGMSITLTVKEFRT